MYQRYRNNRERNNAEASNSYRALKGAIKHCESFAYAEELRIRLQRQLSQNNVILAPFFGTRSSYEHQVAEVVATRAVAAGNRAYAEFMRGIYPGIITVNILAAEAARCGFVDYARELYQELNR